MLLLLFSGQDLITACVLYKSLHLYSQTVQSILSDIEQKPNDLSDYEDYQQ